MFHLVMPSIARRPVLPCKERATLGSTKIWGSLSTTMDLIKESQKTTLRGCPFQTTEHGLQPDIKFSESLSSASLEGRVALTNTLEGLSAASTRTEDGILSQNFCL